MPKTKGSGNRAWQQAGERNQIAGNIQAVRSLVVTVSNRLNRSHSNSCVALRSQALDDNEIARTIMEATQLARVIDKQLIDIVFMLNKVAERMEQYNELMLSQTPAAIAARKRRAAKWGDSI